MHRPKQSRHRNHSGPLSHALRQDLQRESSENELFVGCGEEKKGEGGEDVRDRELAGGPLDIEVAKEQAACEENDHHAGGKRQAGAKLNGPSREKPDPEGAWRAVIDEADGDEERAYCGGAQRQFIEVEENEVGFGEVAADVDDRKPDAGSNPYDEKQDDERKELPA